MKQLTLRPSICLFVRTISRQQQQHGVDLLRIVPQLIASDSAYQQMRQHHIDRRCRRLTTDLSFLFFLCDCFFANSNATACLERFVSEVTNYLLRANFKCHSPAHCCYYYCCCSLLSLPLILLLGLYQRVGQNYLPV